MKNKTDLFSLSLLSSALLAAGAIAADSAGEPGRSSGKKNPLNNVYFGEQHLHTQNSPDAYAMGTRNTTDDAYNFCKGKAVKKNTSGEMVQKKTPYDWCAVTDHAEYFGVMPQLSDPKSDLMTKNKDNEIIKLILSGDPKKGDEAFAKIAVGLTTNNPDPVFNDPEVLKSSWKKHVEVTNKHYDPGKFTTLIAFEWTSIPVNQNLHRNVFFRDDKGPDGPVLGLRFRPPRGPVDLSADTTRRRPGHLFDLAQRQPEQRPHVCAQRLRRHAHRCALRQAAGRE